MSVSEAVPVGASVLLVSFLCGRTVGLGAHVKDAAVGRQFRRAFVGDFENNVYNAFTAAWNKAGQPGLTAGGVDGNLSLLRGGVADGNVRALRPGETGFLIQTPLGRRIYTVGGNERAARPI
jgi:hypothetical protein